MEMYEGEMEMYDYREAMRRDILDILPDYAYVFEYSVDDGELDFKTLRNDLYDELWGDDSPTGNVSDFYTFSSFEAELNLTGNWYLLWDALDEFGGTISRDPKENDTVIRRYLLGEVLDAVLIGLEARVSMGPDYIPDWLNKILEDSRIEDEEEGEE